MDGIKRDEFQFGPWSLVTLSSHILKSQCQTQQTCSQTSAENTMCTVCRYSHALKLPQLPEMVFGDNMLELTHESGFGIMFNALDALKLVDFDKCDIKVAVHKVWKEARSDCEHIDNVVKPYDWTYTNNYMGTLFSSSHPIMVCDTEERIDMNKLKVKEKIYFYQHIHLFEDELADNGISSLSVKVRVMAGKFFILLRFHLRIDNQLVRVHDTRLYHESDKSYILREYSRRECPYSLLEHLEPSRITNPDLLAEYLEVKEEKFERLNFPTTSS